MNDVVNNIIPLGNGERGAMGGYRAQYDEFSRRVYDCILNGNLECIRVADAEENVGKLDDICYVTDTEVHAYQVKWTNNDDTFTYIDFKSLIKQVAEGWKKIKAIYPSKVVIPHLLTNRKCSTADRSIKGNDGKTLGTFADYVENVITPLCSSAELSDKWAVMLDELNKVTGLTEKQSSEFWPLFRFTPDFVEDTIDIAQKVTCQRISDLLDINRLIQEMAASKERRVIASIDDIIRKLGWGARVKTQYDHNLNVLPSEYEPNKAAIFQLNTLLESRHKGYLFLEGTPGSGKSTLITQWVKQIPNKCIRYYAFDFTRPSEQLVNDSDRGDRTTFLFDLIKMMECEGFKSQNDTLTYKEYQFLKNRFIESLNIVHLHYKKTGLCTVIVVDGLDHIDREYKDCIHTLLDVLPSVQEVPDGVVFVLGSQYFKNLRLNRTIREEYMKGGSTILMPPLAKDEVKQLMVKLVGPKIATDRVVEACMSKSQGHPLYLRYILNQISDAQNTETLDDIPTYNGDIETYYAGIIPCMRTNAGMRSFLGLLSRIIGDIKYDFIQEWNINEQVLQDFNNTLRHLFIKNQAARSLAFFHNSFRQYLLNETAKDAFDDAYSEKQNRKYYKELANYTLNSKVINNWSVASYLYMAHEYDAFLNEVSPDNLFSNLQDFRPLWHVRRDVEKMAHIASSKKDVYILMRTLFLQSQLSQMEMQDYSSLTLVNEFLELGYCDMAKMQIRENRELKCTQNYALELARHFCMVGDKAEANILFELSYPEFLSHKPDEFHNRYNALRERHLLLEEWAHTASYFLPLDRIDSELVKFTDYLQEVAEHDQEEYDAEYSAYLLRRKVVDSLVEQSVWNDLEKYLDATQGTDFSLPLRYYAQREKVSLLIKSKASDFIIHDAFESLQGCFANLEGKDKPYLQMASLSQRANMPNEVIDSYLCNVIWENLGSYYINDYQSNFSQFKKHIRYITLRSYLGYDDDMLSLVPNDTSHPDNDLMISYARKVFTLAKLGGKALREDFNEVQLLSIVMPYAQSFDTYNFSDHNRYSYRISQQRPDFYAYIVEIASYFGRNTLRKVANLVCEYFAQESCKATAEAKRKFACALYEYGLDKDYVSDLLSEIETRMYEYQDLDGRQRETYHQGKSWMMLGEQEKAMALFQRLIMESFGVGYRKDYQPSTFAEWINDANNIDPENAIERIHWLTTRLNYINECSESRTGTQAAMTLLEGVIKMNLGAGLKLSKWMLDKEYGYFESVSALLIRCLSSLITSEQEYNALFELYVQIHLSFTDSYDADTSLLECIFKTGQQICASSFEKFSKKLKIAILTNCNDAYSASLLKKLEEMSKPTVDVKSEESNKDYYRKSDSLTTEAKEMLALGNKNAAWDKAMDALAASSSAGWAKIYDGGTRMNACQLLVQIDKTKGQEIAINQFAEDLVNGLGYSEMHYTTEIAHLLNDNIDPLKLFKEQFDYMKRILREDAVCTEDCPDVDFDRTQALEAIESWLTYIAQMPVMSLSEVAKMLLARMIADGFDDVVHIMQKNGASTRTILEVGMYVRELSEAVLGCFMPLVKENAVSENYQYRLFSKSILKSLGENIPIVAPKTLPALYKMYLPKAKTIRLNPNVNPYDGYVDWNDPCSIMSVVSHVMSYLRHCTGIKEINLATRAVQFMLENGTMEDWDDKSDQTVGNHYRNICLYYPYRRPRSLPAIDGMMEVASELIDSGIVDGVYDDNVFMMNDFSVINFEEHPRPVFIPRLTEKDAWSMPKMWEHQASESALLVDKLIEVEHMFVIGQFLQCRQHSDDIPYEEYKMRVSFDVVEQTEDGFFGSSPFQRQTSQYLRIGADDLEIIVRRGGYYACMHNKQNWIAFNPALAFRLGWIPADDGRFAWNDANGNRMVESIYWKSGNVEYRHRSNHETGDGWYVLASQFALEALKEIGNLYSHQHVSRGLEAASFTPISSEAKSFII